MSNNQNHPLLAVLSILVLGIAVFAVGSLTRKNAPIENPLPNRETIAPHTAPVDHTENTAADDEQSADELLAAATEQIIGTWRSTDDAKFVRTFARGGKVTDLYDDKITSEDSWMLFTSENTASIVQAPAIMEPNSVYLQIQTTGATQLESLNFKVTAVTPEKLELIYLDRGNTLKFIRAQ